MTKTKIAAPITVAAVLRGRTANIAAHTVKHQKQALNLPVNAGIRNAPEKSIEWVRALRFGELYALWVTAY